MQATTQRSSWRRCPFVIADCDEKVCPFTVALVMRADALGSVAIRTASVENSLRILAQADASQEIAA